MTIPIDTPIPHAPLQQQARALKLHGLLAHWDAGGAYTVIAFLDLLRDQLWETYGEEITVMLRDAETRSGEPQQNSSDFDDELHF